MLCLPADLNKKKINKIWLEYWNLTENAFLEKIFQSADISSNQWFSIEKKCIGYCILIRLHSCIEDRKNGWMREVSKERQII